MSKEEDSSSQPNCTTPQPLCIVSHPPSMNPQSFDAALLRAPVKLLTCLSSLPFLSRLCHFLKIHLQLGSVILILSTLGISHSCAAILAFLIQWNEQTLKKSWAYVKKCKNNMRSEGHPRSLCHRYLGSTLLIFSVAQLWVLKNLSGGLLVGAMCSQVGVEREGLCCLESKKERERERESRGAALHLSLCPSVPNTVPDTLEALTNCLSDE